MTKTVSWQRIFTASRDGVSRYQYLRLKIPSELQLPNAGGGCFRIRRAGESEPEAG
ncbi:MAG: hypothetical protein LUF32_04745 [Clostridiales bacterium]|nr:hypothetical protein [Clostridiales bacterium]